MFIDYVQNEVPTLKLAPSKGWVIPEVTTAAASKFGSATGGKPAHGLKMTYENT